jgi:hypothetical protein
MLWELLAGIPLFPGSTHEAIAQLLFRKIPRPSQVRPGIAADVEAIAMRLLARDPDERYASAEAAIDALATTADAPRNGRGELVRWLATKFRGAVETGAATHRLRPRVRRTRMVHVAMVGVIAIAVGIGAGVVIEMVTREPVARVVRTSSRASAGPIEPPPTIDKTPAVQTPSIASPTSAGRPASIDKAPRLSVPSARRHVVAIEPDTPIAVDAGVAAPVPDASPVRAFDPDEVGGD